MPNMIRVRPTQDGTYTVYLGTTVLISGLSRLQAERYEAAFPIQRPDFSADAAQP
ncbi:hypothetical protein [Methylobacterium sp. BTF04]|uniref:hypothetical protein n=1 Tax=Methylobacterium sp. BTF04 TaxID=2708300 RepID=UPI0019531202|nr:hypothetical protein [Methylobacterium sp. BTF04]